MIEKDANRSDPADLRRQAEEQLRKNPADVTAIPPEEAGRLFHELQVHQIELEMQNEELRRAQKELAASRVKYFDLYDMAPVGYLTVSEKGLILEANLTADILLGVAQRALAKEFLTRFILTEDQDIYYRHNKQLFKTGEPHACELRMVKKDGIPFWARLDATVAQGVDGAPVCRVVLKDITERKRAEEALRESEYRYRTLFSRASDGIFIVSPDGKLIEVNESFAQMHGYSTGELLQMNTKDLDAPEALKLFPERMARLLAGETLTFEVEHYHKDGHVIPLEAVARLVSFGGESYIQSFHRDITDRKRAEIEKEKLQAQLRQAMKMEAVGRLAGGVAHDFNNLLTVITGYSELLLQKIGKESPMHREVKEIMRAGERAASLTQQLLAFSRKQIIAPKVLDLNLLTADLGKMLVRLIGENIDMKTVHGKGLGLVKVDPGQFEQVLMNLAVNGRDAMSDGGTLLIETANVELDEEYCAQRPYQIHPGRFVRLAVSDTGHGMTEETSKQIFEPFFTTKAKGKGTGLGLSMIYGAVKQSGGSIEVYSEVGKGTTFKIYLPRVEEEAAKQVEDVRPRDLPGGTETVLLVEDEDMVRDLCVRVLDELGYRVLQAPNGKEAIALSNGHGGGIDLLMTDVVMPGMNGSELATQLILHRPEMRVLFTSGYTDNAIVYHGVLDEGVSFIGKPYTPLALARKVREVLDRK